MAIASQGIIAAAGDERSLLARLQALDVEYGHLCAANKPGLPLTDRLWALVNDSRLPKGSLLHVSSAVDDLNRLVFDHLGLQASRDLKDPCNLLPSRILDRRQGYCVGVAAVYLVLAEEVGLPVHAVATPSHVFLRFDDGVKRFNIETLQGGKNLPDEQYIEEYRIPRRSIRSGVFMRDMTTDEFLAQLHNNLGVLYSERNVYERAAAEYDRALDLDPWLPAAYYNYGTDLLQRGQHRRAVRLLSKSLRLYPTDVWALNNRGRAYLDLGLPEKARRDFETALRIDPRFEQARRNLAQTPSAQ